MKQNPLAPQPAPIPVSTTHVWPLIIERVRHDAPTRITCSLLADMEERNRQGIERYGVALQPHNGRNPWIDAYQEALDLCAYLMQASMEPHTPAVHLLADAMLNQAIKQAHDIRAILMMME